MCSCATGWFSSHVFFGVVSILIALHCWCVRVLHAHIYMREPSLHCQPAAALGTSRILVLPVVPCVCAGSTLAPFASLYFFSPKQIIFLHLIKDVSRRLGSICRLSAVSQFSLSCYVFSFLSILRVCLQLSCISPLVQNLKSALWKKK